MENIDYLTTQQAETGKKICELFELIKKEPIPRRTETYVQRRESEIKTLWDIFNKQHREILALNHPEHEYFTKKYFQQVENIKEKVCEKLNLYSAALNGASNFTTTEVTDSTTENIKKADDTINTGSSDININCLRRKREKIRIESFRKQIERLNVNDEMSNSTIEFHCKILTEDWRQLECLHEEVLMFNESGLEIDYLSDEFENLRDEYTKLVISLQEKKLLNTNTPSENDVRLPRLNIPIFEGRYENWTAFHDIFTRLIHNNKRLANVEKMQYLKTNLKGEAGRLLNHLEISDNNYSIAWEIIKERYENKRKLLSVHIQTLLALPRLDNETPNGLKRIHDTVRECLHGITNLGVDTTSWAPIIIHLMTQKFDFESLKLYEQSLANPKEIPTYESFYNFLTGRFQSLEAIVESRKRDNLHQKLQTRHNEKPKSSPIRNYSTMTEQNCRYCQKPHILYACSEFQVLSAYERNKFITKKKLCPNCLNHDSREACHSRYRCYYCQQKHHSLLHKEGHKYKKETLSVQTHFTDQNKSVLLATALIRIQTASGKYELVRALIDPGSQGTFITESAAQILSLPKTKIHAQVAGLGASITGTSRSKILLNIQPRFPSRFQTTVEALVLPKLTKSLPEADIRLDIPWKNTMLADPTFNKSGPIDVLIGADTYATIILEGVKRMTKNLVTQNTELGWIVLGQIQNYGNHTKIISMVSQIEINNQLKKFWEIEEVPTEHNPTTEDNICENHFTRTHKRNNDGTYIVEIPFKKPKLQLGESKKKALARLLQNERKFLKNKKLEEGYKNFMAEYIKLGHMIPAGPPKNPENTYYIPHQAVFKQDSSTTKLRVVFDASSESTTGESLNDTMYTGPRLQSDLSQLLLRWRKHKYVFTADIEKMYRQIKVADHNQDFQRILWRFSPTEPIQEYKLTTVTYGTASAPYLAIRTLQQHAKNEEQFYPEAAQVILKDFYVDDMMSGTNSIQEALKLQKDLIQLLGKGGFKLRKWTSNNQTILKQVPEDMRESNILEISDSDTIKTLGIHWNPNTDTFCFKVGVQVGNEKLTKRTLLSDTAKIFDPLGWLTPVTVQAKIILQQLWKANLAWDEPLPPHLENEWHKYKRDMAKLENIKISRWLSFNPKTDKIELHGFCDASEKAYAAVIQ